MTRRELEALERVIEWARDFLDENGGDAVDEDALRTVDELVERERERAK